MTATAMPAAGLLPPATTPDRETGWWAMACVCATEAAFFAYLITAYWYLAMRAPHWPPPGIAVPELPIPLCMTAALLSSSVAMWWAERGARRHHPRQAAAGLAGAMVLGLVFVTLFATEYRTKLRALLPQTHAYGSLFYVITGVHGMHVIFGLLMIAFTLLRVTRRRPDRRWSSAVSIVALYWHFVDVVWLVILANLYLTPRIA